MTGKGVPKDSLLQDLKVTMFKENIKGSGWDIKYTQYHFLLQSIQYIKDFFIIFELQDSVFCFVFSVQTFIRSDFEIKQM